MWNNSNNDSKAFTFDQSEEERLAKRKKALIDQEVEQYAKTLRQQVRAEVEEEKLAMKQEVTELAQTCAVQKGEFEHTFHQKKEELKTELAKLEAKVEVMKEVTSSFDARMQQKDAEIDRLNNIVESLITAFNVKSLDSLREE